jgi:hypothetical protein
MIHPFTYDLVEASANWQPCANSESRAVPAGGAVRVTGSSTGYGFSVARPTAPGQYVWIAAPQGLASQGYGACAEDGLFYALYDSTDGTPAVGETWGAGADTYKLKKNCAGFLVVGTPDTVNAIVPVVRGCMCPSGPPPAAPTSVAATPAFNSIVTTWTDPAGVPPATSITALYTVSNDFNSNLQPFTIAAGVETHTLSTINDGNDYYLSLKAVGANGATSSWTPTVTVTKPILKQLTIDATGTTLTLTYNQAVTHHANTVAVHGDESATATYSSGNGTTTLVYTLSATVHVGSDVLADVSADTDRDASGSGNVLMNNCPVTNNSLVSTSCGTVGEWGTGCSDGTWDAPVSSGGADCAEPPVPPEPCDVGSTAVYNCDPDAPEPGAGCAWIVSPPP